ncbi:DsrE family protein [Aliidiomarina indica]|uniref:DsrE family protein n=1 Tax=Aliidiomarina indica TaxID=2749147 RepID=UPI00188E6BF9|nr:DsrE family protein [Aliidiomarina indica]
MITLIFNERPHHPSARHGLDMLLMLVTLEQPSSALFVGEGIWQLVEPVNQPDPLKKIGLLPNLFEFERFYTTQDSLTNAGLSENHLRVPVTILSASEVDALLHRDSKHRISFGREPQQHN